MIRPREGDFIYTEDELNQMIESIKFCKKLGVEGIIFEILNEDRKMNYQQIEKLVGIASPLKVVLREGRKFQYSGCRKITERNIGEVHKILVLKLIMEKGLWASYRGTNRRSRGSES